MENDVDEGEQIILKKGDEEIVLTEKRLRELTSRFIESASMQAVDHQDFGMNTKMVELLLDAKRAYFPSINRNLNLNVQDFDSKIMKWTKAREEMKKAQSEGLTVMEVVNDK